MGMADMRMRGVDSSSSLDISNLKIRQLSIINEQEFRPKKGLESDCSPMLASPVPQD